jgi:hypothetical protein
MDQALYSCAGRLTYCQQHGEVACHVVGKGLGIVCELRIRRCSCDRDQQLAHKLQDRNEGM